ncbi:hypothetical protein GJAV_G00186780 [Gymnothorax javanicus]|nr:hypothetical protein GJAV_G00186780 [Gymnothorax javanicus]
MQKESEFISAVLKEYSQFPSPVSVTVCSEVPASPGTSYINLFTEWSQNDTERGVRLRYSKQYTLLCAERVVLHALPPGYCSHVKEELLSSHSPSGTLKAIVRETDSQGKAQQFLEIWDRHGYVKSLDLTSLNKHGKLYGDAQFGCLAWSACESRLLYVAERRPFKEESFTPLESISGKDSTAGKEDHSVYLEDWGEGLSDKSAPVLCVADIGKCTVTVLKGVPTQVSPGQALWSPGDEGVVFVGWWHEPFRLGLKFCSNRRSALFHVDLDGNCECLSSDQNAVSSPRLSPDRSCIVYLQGQVFGPHKQCLSLHLYDWETRKNSLLLDIVKRPQDGEFAGLYEALPSCCWSSDSQRVVFSSGRRNFKELFVVNRCTKTVSRLVGNEEFGSWNLLAIDKDLMVVNCSSLDKPPCVRVGFLPSVGGESGISWTPLNKSQQIPHLEWKILNVTPSPQEENIEFSGLDFGALLVKPRGLRSGVTVPLVVFAHGGPHSQITAEWNVSFAALARLGFAVLMVNYRGSTGFGQDSIQSLIGNIGSQDVKDMQRAVLTALQSDTTLDPGKVAVMGGSHGGFLACHLIGQYPDFYRACAARNPVINAATLLGTSDIIDWRYSSVGLQYSFDRLPSPDALTAMFQVSPIAHASHIRTPVLLMLGGKDRRVPPYQGLELYRALKGRNSPVRLLWFAEDGHSLSRVDTQTDCFLNIVLWFQKHLDLH